MLIYGATVRGIERRKLLSLCSRERGALFQGLLCSLSIVVVSVGHFGCTSEGYGERETSFALLEREGGTFSGHTMLAACLSKVVVVFVGKQEAKME